MIIGISGNNGSGKDIFGMLLQAECERAGKDVKRVAFANALYFIASYLYGTKTKKYYDANPEHKNDIVFDEITVRDLLIKIGACMRDIRASTWVDLVKELDHEVIIVTDVRFDNESAICDAIFQVTREGQDENVGQCFGEVIENNGTIDELAEKAKEVYNGLFS